MATPGLTKPILQSFEHQPSFEYQGPRACLPPTHIDRDAVRDQIERIFGEAFFRYGILKKAGATSSTGRSPFGWAAEPSAAASIVGERKVGSGTTRNQQTALAGQTGFHAGAGNRRAVRKGRAGLNQGD